MSSAAGLLRLNAGETPRAQRKSPCPGWWMAGLGLNMSYCGLGRRRGAVFAEVQASNFNFSGKVFKSLLRGYRSVNNSKLHNSFAKTGRGNTEKLINLRPLGLLLLCTRRSRSRIAMGFLWAGIILPRGDAASPTDPGRAVVKCHSGVLHAGGLHLSSPCISQTISEPESWFSVVFQQTQFLFDENNDFPKVKP